MRFTEKALSKDETCDSAAANWSWPEGTAVSPCGAATEDVGITDWSGCGTAAMDVVGDWSGCGTVIRDWSGGGAAAVDVVRDWSGGGTAPVDVGRDCFGAVTGGSSVDSPAACAAADGRSVDRLPARSVATPCRTGVGSDALFVESAIVVKDPDGNQWMVQH